MKFTYVTLEEYESKRTPVSTDTQTMPDLTLTVPELFDRMARGLPLSPMSLPVYYDDNEDIDNPDPTQRPGFDLVDYTEEMMNLESVVESCKHAQSVQSNQSSEALKDADVSDSANA